jgi:hypothetical protein
MPWTGYLAKVAQADVFVYLDTVQYQKGGLQNRNQIWSPNGPMWLTVPVTGSHKTHLRDIAIADPRFRGKHRRALEHNYAKARHRDCLAPIMSELERDWAKLTELTVTLAARIFEAFDIGTEIRLASEFDVPEERVGRVIGICKELGATTYLSGTGARVYQEPAFFNDAGLDLEYQSFEPLPYEQFPGKPFEPGLSSLDVIAHLGDQAPAYLASCIRESVKA